MSVIGAIAAGGALLSGVGSLISGAQEQKQGQLNYQLAKEQHEWQKGMVDKVFQREDTAMQRRVSDLKAAGLNPILAAGGPGAGAQPVQNIAAPQLHGSGAGAKGVAEFGMSGTRAIEAYQGIQANQAVIEKTMADARAANATANRTDAETSRVLGTTPFEIQLKEAEAKIADTLSVHQEDKSVAEIRKLISETELSDLKKASEIRNAEMMRAHTQLFEIQSRTEAKREGLIDAQVGQIRQETALTGKRLTQADIEIARADLQKRLEEALAPVVYLEADKKYVASSIAAQMMKIELELLTQEAKFRLEKGMPQNIITSNSFNERLINQFDGLNNVNVFLQLLRESVSGVQSIDRDLESIFFGGR